MTLSNTITVKKWLNISQLRLKSAGIETPNLDSLVLLEDCVGVDRGWLLAHPELKLKNAQINRLNEQINLRSQQLPLSYIRHKTEFYGREFYIDARAFEPRFESEAMIDLLKLIPITNTRIKVVEVGTGTGAIGITVALELPKCQIKLLEIDSEAIKVAKKNIYQHNLDLPIVKSNLLSQVKNSFDILLANLPYVPNNYPTNNAAKKEPAIAIFGGDDGLNLYRKLWDQLTTLKKKPSFVLIESLPKQHNQLINLAKACNYRLARVSGFIQCFAKEAILISQ